MSQQSDPRIEQLREQVSDNDRELVETFNRRLELVAQIKSVKTERGIDFVDPEREAWMLRHLLQANSGPLSEEGLRELYRTVLDLTKREVARGESGPAG